MKKVKYLIPLIAGITILFSPLSSHTDYQNAFDEFDYNQQEKTYNTAISYVENQEDLKEYFTNLSTNERLNLLAYIGMTNYEDSDISTLTLHKQFSSSLIPFTKIKAEDVAHTSMAPHQKFISEHAKKMIMANRYNDELARLYPLVAKRKPLDFWQSFDLFKNMLAFGRKNSTLYTGSSHLKHFKNLEDMLEADVNFVTQRVGMAYIDIRFDYDKSRGAAAWYSIQNNQITINLAEENLTWSRLVGEILWHEAFHAYQNHLVETYRFDDRHTQEDFYSNATENQRYQLWLSGIYNANISAYQISEHSFSLYSAQPLERHAGHFGRDIYKMVTKVKF